MNESTVIGYVHGESVKGHFMRSVCDLLEADFERGPSRRRIVGRIDHESGPRIAAARNDIVRSFLKTEASWLLMLDDDMVFSPETVNKLYQAAHPRDYPIVGGLCFGGGRSGIMFPTLYVLQKMEKPGDEPIRIVEDYPEDALCKVDATGAAFLLMHRDALAKIEAQFGEPYPWFAEGSVYKGIPFGEDWAFCLRAGALDIPIHVHTGAKVGHIKPQILDATAWEGYKAERESIGEEGIKSRHRGQVNG